MVSGGCPCLRGAVNDLLDAGLVQGRQLGVGVFGENPSRVVAPLEKVLVRHSE
jgi:hypothetical protein